jgi:anti-sigma regulatory factor (Ser/Thr protein kinase)
VGTRESENDRMTWQVKGADAVTQASDAARIFGEAQWLTEDEVARLCIILEELVTNLYDHGGVGHDDAVTLSLASDPAGIRITIVDPGTPFDPRQSGNETDRPERGGGAGIDIVRAWAMVIDYEVTDQGNRLELLLPLLS